MNQSSNTQLAAILFSDIEGYSAMMQQNRTLAVETVATYKKTLMQQVAAFKGEVLNDYGDGSLCIFHSATDAVHCAMALQTQFRAAPNLPAEQVGVPLRIGIHIGEM